MKLKDDLRKKDSGDRHDDMTKHNVRCFMVSHSDFITTTSRFCKGAALTLKRGPFGVN